MGFLEDVTSPPARFSIVNLATNEELVAQFNATEFEDGVGAEFDKLSTPGQSHQRMHFKNTENYGSAIDLLWRANTVEEYDEVNRARHLLMSWCYPLARGGPPRLLATWPEVFSIECYLMSVRFRNEKFRKTGGVTRMTASCRFEEVRDQRLTSDQVALVVVVRGEL